MEKLRIIDEGAYEDITLVQKHLPLDSIFYFVETVHVIYISVVEALVQCLRRQRIDLCPWCQNRMVIHNLYSLLVNTFSGNPGIRVIFMYWMI